MNRTSTRAGTLGRAAETLDPSGVLTLHLDEGARRETGFGHAHEVESRPLAALVLAKALADEALRPVSGDGVSDPPTDADPETVVPTGVLGHDQKEEGAVETTPRPEDMAKLRPGPEPLLGPKTSAPEPVHRRT